MYRLFSRRGRIKDKKGLFKLTKILPFLTAAVNTGDDNSKLVIYIVLAAAAVLIVAALFFLKNKK